MIVDTLGNIFIVMAPVVGLTLVLAWVILRRKKQTLVQQVEEYLRKINQ